MMIAAFLLGGGVQFLAGSKADFSGRNQLYQIVALYLLFKIGFSGGLSLIAEDPSHTLFTGGVAVLLSVIWTLIVVEILKMFRQISVVDRTTIAAHFGSVSVGTFAAALAFLQAVGLTAADSVVLWLALMELPAIFVGVFLLKIPIKHLLKAIAQDRSLLILIVSIGLGFLLGEHTPAAFKVWFLGWLFTPAILYFLFEMGRKAADSLFASQVPVKAMIGKGVGLAAMGGFFGASMGFLLGYPVAESFILSILMASASYVLVPICMEEILKSALNIKPKQAEAAVAFSMALSVGVVLPFNLLVGFELYYGYLWLLPQLPHLAWVGVLVPLSCFWLAFWYHKSR